jgi:HAD superfamily hydrolase (TIGR01549 family)
MYKALLIDLDNTLYSYDICHKFALDMIDINVETYNCARGMVKCKGNHTHNRTEYFELIPHQQGKGVQLTEAYWNHFMAKIAPFEGVIEFLQWHRDLHIPVCIITDFDRNIQQRKLQALGIDTMIDHMVCCSDTGCDKPSPVMFYTALHKLSKQPIECCMIGDNVVADIKGANDVGIRYTFHYGKDFTSYLALLERFKTEQSLITNFVTLCKAISERPDWVQACGGNVSVKLPNGDILIKASGEHLSNVTQHTGYVIVDNYGNHILCSGKPSIETSFHQKLKYKYVVHVHSIATIATPPDKFREVYPTAQILPYYNPGKDIADAISDSVSADVVYLQNHGLIIASNRSTNLVDVLDQICKACETAIGLNFDRYRELSTISDKIRLGQPTYVTIPTDITTDIEIKPCTPDIAVYLGDCILTPYKGKYYISAANISKCRHVLDVLDSTRYLHAVPTLDSDAVKTLCMRSDELYRMNITP